MSWDCLVTFSLFTLQEFRVYFSGALTSLSMLCVTHAAVHETKRRYSKDSMVDWVRLTLRVSYIVVVHKSYTTVVTHVSCTSACQQLPRIPGK